MNNIFLCEVLDKTLITNCKAFETSDLAMCIMLRPEKRLSETRMNGGSFPFSFFSERSSWTCPSTIDSENDIIPKTCPDGSCVFRSFAASMNAHPTSLDAFSRASIADLLISSVFLLKRLSTTIMMLFDAIIGVFMDR